MNEYILEIKETSILRYSVAAKNAKDAKKYVQTELQNGKIMMDEGKFEWEIALVSDEGANSETR